MSWDVDASGDGFAEFVARDDRMLPPVVEAAQIDGAFRDVFRAPPVVTFRPSALEAASLLDAQLRLSPALRIVRQSSLLLPLRRQVLRERPARVAVPDALGTSEWWAILRTETGTRELRLEPREAELLVALGGNRVRDALAWTERACSEAERKELPTKTRAWLARAVLEGFFADPRGIVD